MDMSSYFPPFGRGGRYIHPKARVDSLLVCCEWGCRRPTTPTRSIAAMVATMIAAMIIKQGIYTTISALPRWLRAGDTASRLMRA